VSNNTITPEYLLVPNTVLCKLSGLSCDDWGISEEGVVFVFPDEIRTPNRADRLGHNIAFGKSKSELRSRVWKAALRWSQGGDK